MTCGGTLCAIAATGCIRGRGRCRSCPFWAAGRCRPANGCCPCRMPRAWGRRAGCCMSSRGRRTSAWRRMQRTCTGRSNTVVLCRRGCCPMVCCPMTCRGMGRSPGRPPRMWARRRTGGGCPTCRPRRRMNRHARVRGARRAPPGRRRPALVSCRRRPRNPCWTFWSMAGMCTPTCRLRRRRDPDGRGCHPSRPWMPRRA